MLKTIGYLISGLSVVLLGVVSGKAASGDPLLFACLVLGMATSVVGMLCRWWTYRRERRGSAPMSVGRARTSA